MKKKLFAPEWKLVDEHATKAQLPLQDRTIRVRGEITKENAIRWLTCAVMHRRSESFEVWERRAPAVEAAIERWKEES